MNNKTVKLFCCVALLAALALVCVLFLHYRDLGAQLKTTQLLLTESRNTWETIAAEKEALQDQKKALENDLKEAKLSLTEAQEKTKKARDDIDTLTQEIADLKLKLPQP
jgi:septal ring factor EnvC (AmiA/AmiB activator)